MSENSCEDMRLNQCKFDKLINGIGIVLQMLKISMFAVSGQQPLSLRRSVLCRNSVTTFVATPLLQCRNSVTILTVIQKRNSIQTHTKSVLRNHSH